jgi:hypothetical protein
MIWIKAPPGGCRRNWRMPSRRTHLNARTGWPRPAPPSGRLSQPPKLRTNVLPPRVQANGRFNQQPSIFGFALLLAVWPACNAVCERHAGVTQCPSWLARTSAAHRRRAGRRRCRRSRARCRTGHMIRPAIGVHRGRMGAAMVPAIDQHAANTGIAHFAEGDLLRVVRHGVSIARQS